ncbi:MAG: hypothetical protein JW739_04905 [Opitutales bacterium]|nr:hypothetical protein [Opitutales bacterium]
MSTSLEKDQAWIGDAVLALYAREWILQNVPASEDRTETFKRMTCNQFLSGVGEPTSVEAGIGRVYECEGLQVAFKYIEETLLPLFLKQQNRRKPGRR